MQITLNQSIYNTKNNNYYYKFQHKNINQNNNLENISEYSPVQLSAANFPNVNFRMNADAKFLLSQNKIFNCAYTDSLLLSPQELHTIYKKLQKRPNIQSAINLLCVYEKYMLGVESGIYGIFSEAPHKGKYNFQDILNQLRLEAIIGLKSKQDEILESITPEINMLSKPLKKEVLAIRDEAYEKMYDDTFYRRRPLAEIKSIKGGEETPILIDIYRKLYKLPNSSRNIDAFIVKYAKEDHQAIARRLVSTAGATIEHTIPKARGGQDDLENFLLVSARFNNERDTMSLGEFIMLNDDIPIKDNLQKYVDKAIRQINNRTPAFVDKIWYPDSIKENVLSETNNEILLDTSALKPTKAQVKDNQAHKKLNEKYIVMSK